MAIRCGSCKQYHGSVAEVRDCHTTPTFQVSARTRTPRLPNSTYDTPKVEEVEELDAAFSFVGEGTSVTVGDPVAPVVGCTERQEKFLDDLLATREHTFDASWVAKAKSGKREASASISKLLVCQERKAPAPQYAVDADGVKDELPAVPLPDVPAGRFALRNVPGYNNEISFFKVDRPTEGRWAGRIFVKHFASDTEYPVRGEGARKILDLIAANIEEAFALYGLESSHCGVCSRKLTDDDSRARGIGPICIQKMGF